MKIDDGGTAFPTGDDHESLGNPQYYSPGISARWLFAGMAMQGFLSNSVASSVIGGRSGSAEAARDLLSSCAVTYADALIAELRRTEAAQ